MLKLCTERPILYYRLNNKLNNKNIFPLITANPSMRKYQSTSTETTVEDTIYEFRLRRKFNTFFNVCPQQTRMVVERFGKFYFEQNSGYFFAIPFIDKIRYVIDMRELTVPVHPHSAITKDNVSVDLGGNVYIQFNDAYKAAYGAQKPIYAVIQHAQSAMRAIVGETTLDELFHNRNKINTYILQSLLKAIEPWGLTVHRYEVTSVKTEESIHNAMNKQASAERQRREDILHAEAVKRTLELESEGQRQKLINESEGNKIDSINHAQGRAEAIRLGADAEYYSLIKEADGRAKALGVIGSQLDTEEGSRAGRYELSTQYIKEYGKIVGKSNTILIPNGGDDVSGFVAKAISIYNGVQRDNPPVTLVNN